MNIYAKRGDKVKCVTFNAGYRLEEQEAARKYLKKGKVYTVERTMVFNWKTDVYLQEFPGVAFNSVFFADQI